LRTCRLQPAVNALPVTCTQISDGWNFCTPLQAFMLSGVMSAYYNEIDPYAAQWLRNLIDAGHIAPGDVDERSILDVHPDDLKNYNQCHFFAGIGGWSFAARLAGWSDDRPLWTGSCPCQPFSSAARGAGKGLRSEKHLWPEWFRLVRSIRPAIIFGEQVASSAHWTDQVADDLEGEDFAFWSTVIPAGAIGADHIRYRQWFLSYPNSNSEPRRAEHAKASGLSRSDRVTERMVQTNGIPDRVATLRAFGNAIVPQVAAEIVKAYLSFATSEGYTSL
jgi:DNA (cytosine-5)-methyltransferase 1